MSPDTSGIDDGQRADHLPAFVLADLAQMPPPTRLHVTIQTPDSGPARTVGPDDPTADRAIRPHVLEHHARRVRTSQPDPAAQTRHRLLPRPRRSSARSPSAAPAARSHGRDGSRRRRGPRGDQARRSARGSPATVPHWRTTTWRGGSTSTATTRWQGPSIGRQSRAPLVALLALTLSSRAHFSRPHPRHGPRSSRRSQGRLDHGLRTCEAYYDAQELAVRGHLLFRMDSQLDLGTTDTKFGTKWPTESDNDSVWCYRRSVGQP